MKILVVGNGGREHAMVWKLAQSPRVDKIYCAAGNAGIGQLAELVPIQPMEIDKLVAFAKENAIDFTAVGMDDPLAAGIVDAFQAAGLRVFGPRKNAALIESSKAFSKGLMKKYGIPTAAYETFTDPVAARAYVEKHPLPVVLMADGLALGKGVLICQTREEALAGLDEIMVSKKFGAAGNTVVVEEFLTGPEVSVLAFCDGTHLVPMVSAQDHKRALDNDQGLNTGGMGAFSPSKIYTPEVAATCMETIFMPTVRAMAAEGRPFVGCLYFGLMLTPDGMKVIEYNCRFGDPETQAVLPRLKSDLLTIMEACVDGTLDKTPVEWADEAAVCVVLASGGYPESYQKGYPITGLAEAEARPNTLVFHAGTAQKDGQFVTNGGRVLGVVGLGKTMEEAIATAYAGADCIQFEKKHFRHDIGIKKNQ